MAKKPKDYKEDLLHQGFDATETDYNQRGYHLEVALNVNQVRKFAQTAYDLGFYIVFVAGLHVRPDEGQDKGSSGLEVVYQFARYDQLYRIKARVSAPKSLEQLYQISIRALTGMKEKPGIFMVLFLTVIPT